MRIGRRIGTILAAAALCAGLCLPASAGASKVQYYKTVGEIYGGDILYDNKTQEQIVGITAKQELGLAGIDTEDKKVGEGSLFQKCLAASSTSFSTWICGPNKWQGKGSLDISGASRPAFVMWFYVSDAAQLREGDDGTFVKVRVGSDAVVDLSRNDDVFYSFWFKKDQIQTGWNYLIAEIKKDASPNGSYMSNVDGFEVEVTTGPKKVNLSKMDWFVLDLYPNKALTYKIDYVSYVDLAVKQDAPSDPVYTIAGNEAAGGDSTTTAAPGNTTTKAPGGATTKAPDGATTKAPGGNQTDPASNGGVTSGTQADSGVSDASDASVPADESSAPDASAGDSLPADSSAESAPDSSGEEAVNGEAGGGLSGGLIAGIVLLIVAVLGGGGAAVYFLVIKKKQTPTDPPQGA